MFKPGAILKITVKNFVTYTNAEMYPGPNLNMLIGPNGTGKSTIVAAIILGLGGSPKIVGRGTKISEYVKHNCSEAMIEIVLQGNYEQTTDVITREFTIDQVNTWKINGSKVSTKELYEFIKKYNIQVENLCQFLPQDRVQDFAKMNKQELLKQTQVALCKDELAKKQEQLIEKRERHKNLTENLEKHNKNLQELQDANIRLEGKVNNFRKRKKYLENMKHIERKVAWVNFEILQDKREEVKNDRTKAAEILDKHKNTLKPITNAINKAKKSVSDLNEKLNNSNNAINTVERNITQKLEIVKQLKDSIKNIEGDKNLKLRELEQKENEIISSRLKLENLAQNKQEIISKFGSDTEVAAKLQKHQEEIQLLNRAIRSYEDKRITIEASKREKLYEIRNLENEVQNIENVKQQRLEWLRRFDKHAYNATIWLRQNKHLFKGEVYEPMILELNVLNPNHAIYVENTIPTRDRVAFTCTLKEDMNTLVRILREQEGFLINVVHSGGDDSFQLYQPKIPIEQLKQYGLYAYLNSLFVGPDPIMKYLCKNYGIHNIPVGNHLTNSYYDAIPREINVFFSDKCKFSTLISKYTMEKITRQSEIKSNGGMSISLDSTRLDELRGKIHDIQTSLEKDNEQISNFAQQIANLTDRITKCRNDAKNFQISRQQIQQINTRITALKTRIEEMQQETQTIEDIQIEASRKIKVIIDNMLKNQTELQVIFNNYSNLIIDNELNRISLDSTRQEVTFLENNAMDLQQQCQEAETALNRIKEVYSQVVKEAKVAFQKAKDLSNGFTPDDEGFNEFRDIFEKLSNDFTELDAEREHMQTKIDCLNTADDGEMVEYENRMITITELKEEIVRYNTELTEINNNMDILRDEWLKPLNELVNEINNRFSAAFERMDCAGEVSLYTGENEKNFQQYGLSIKVTYRNGEPLQELNMITQSGGERAVATAIFMLSLQELTPVPFRCVDEINQGMDANNERRIFELLVDSTSQPNTSQYFLITPKLIPNLKFVPTMKIHIVHNGPFVCEQSKWNRHQKKQSAFG